MVEALHLGSVGLAAVGACCAAAADGRDKTLGIFIALLMLAAMIDSMLYLTGIPVVGWALILVLTSVVSGLISSYDDRQAEQHQVQSREHLAMHRNIGLILMAGLIVVMNDHAEGSIRGHQMHTYAFHGELNLLHLVLGGGSTLYLATSIWLALRSARTRIPARLESASMGLSVLTMGSAWII